MRLLLSLFLMAGCAMGQTQQTPIFWRKGDPKILMVPDCPAGFDCLWFDAEGAIHLPTVMCSKSVKLGNSTRAIKEVFPGECAPKHWRIDWTTPQGVPTPQIGECYQVVDDGENGSELKKVECHKPQSK